jgi:ABC-type branched-subunit amino acid transport system substrate-binding protein
MVSYRGVAWLVLAACALGGSAAAAHADCVADIGVVLPLTGPIAAVAQGMVKSADLAAEQINAAGGVNGCKVALLMRDSQGQPSLAVDAARQLVDVSHVGAIVGEALTGPTMAILTSVTAPSGTVLLSPTASAPTFSAIGAKTGLFFRTNVSDALQGVAAASYARREQAGRVAILAVNNDWGKNLSQVFGTAYQALGGPAPKMEFYNPGQSSYRAEVTSLIGDDPDSFYLIGYAAEGAGIVRDWLSQGGTQRLIFAHNLNDAKFVAAVGAKFLRRAVWLTPGESETPSLKDFDAAYTARYKEPAAGPGRTGTYDVVVLAALGMQAAKTTSDGHAIAAGIRKATDPAGVPADATTEGLRRALQDLAAGKPVDYRGAVGPLHFDRSGDIAIPFVTWKLDPSGQLIITDRMSVSEVETLRQKLMVK